MEKVYIFDFGDKIKVGRSSDVHKRMRTIECHSGVRAKNVYAVDGDIEIEQFVHSLLDNRLVGEFFAFPFDEAKAILDKVVSGEIPMPPKKEKSEREERGMVTTPGINFNKLFVLLKEKRLTMYDLRKNKIVGTATIEKMRKGEGHVDTRSIEKLCEYLDCQPGDIMEYIPKDDKTPTA